MSADKNGRGGAALFRSPSSYKTYYHLPLFWAGSKRYLGTSETWCVDRGVQNTQARAKYLLRGDPFFSSEFHGPGTIFLGGTAYNSRRVRSYKMNTRPFEHHCILIVAAKVICM